MNVGPMHMAMCQRFVRVKMFVPAGQFPGLVHVLVVLVVLVRMGVCGAFVPVQVPMQFAIEEEHPGEHDQCRDPVLSRGTFSKNQDRKDGADKRT